MTEPSVRVGILSAPAITLVFHGDYTLAGKPVRCNHPVCIDASVIGAGRLVYEPESDSDTDACFEVFDVVIGVDFHWERKENQFFRGKAELFVSSDGNVTLVNILPAEEYLLSVISSEMSADASEQFLKAHAVISRSWLLAQIGGHRSDSLSFPTCTRSDRRLIKWYDHTDHSDFDVCADDHCQRYQGIARQTTDAVRRAVCGTAGEVLLYHGTLVDARFSKCCGGVFEKFENCWEPVPHAYLQARRDAPSAGDFPDLTVEENARRWILSRPDAYCASPSQEVLSQVLNGYDRETSDFYRWRVEYDRDTIAAIVRERSGIDFGYIVDLQPLERGTSGRIVVLRIVGTECTMEIGKELEIRRTLSRSHLYSSAFVVERLHIAEDGVPDTIVLHGAGWGHGVGLCQIGAAVMGASGYDYKTILGRYFIGADIKKIY